MIYIPSCIYIYIQRDCSFKSIFEEELIFFIKEDNKLFFFFSNIDTPQKHQTDERET